MVGVGRIAVTGHDLFVGGAAADPITGERSRSVAGAGTGCRFCADESGWAGGFAGGFARARVGGGYYFHTMSWSLPQDDAANEGIGESFAGRDRFKAGHADDRS